MNQKLTGNYPTPEPFASMSHDYLDEYLPSEWRANTVVWDPCCGCGNLEKGLSPLRLYMSTLEPEEAEQAAADNPDAHVFQHDFLNDEHLPENLVADLADPGVNFLFLMNPPFKGPSSGIHDKGVKGLLNTRVKEKVGKMGGGSDLQTQFLAHALYLRPDAYIGLFSKYGIHTAPKCEELRNHLGALLGGFMFPADTFQGITAQWPVMFSVLDNALTNPMPGPEPAEEIEPPEEFTNDCLIYTLFHGSNQTSSFTAEYKGEEYFIDNQFHPFGGGTYVQNLINNTVFSDEALEVLEAGEKVYGLFDEVLEELDLERWKIENSRPGWYQVRNSLKDKGLGTEELGAVKEAHLKLGEKIRPMVYELGFLPEPFVND